MQIQKVKLDDVASILTGLPINRYADKEDSIKQHVIQNKSIDEIDKDFKIMAENVSKDIKEQFYSQEHDILYKVQQQSFAKEITTETEAIIPNSYIIIRVNEDLINPSFLVNYLNNPIVNYEIQRKNDTTRIMKVNTTLLKDLTISLPDRDIQDKYATLLTKIYERIEVKRKSIDCDKELINSLYDKVIGDTYAR